MSKDDQQLQSRLEQIEHVLEDTRKRCEAAEKTAAHERRRARVAAGVGLAAVVGAVLISPANRAALAQGLTLASLNVRVTALETKTADISLVVSPDDSTIHELVFKGVNVRIINGTGNNGIENKVGNLIVGYNTRRSSGNTRTGSHNLIVGDYNNYDAYGAIISGFICTSSSPYGSVLGGSYNSAISEYTTICGGSNNTANAFNATVCGGSNNVAEGPVSAILGGDSNLVLTSNGSISGGQSNIVNGYYGSILGGRYNEVTGDYANVSGGNHNYATGEFSSVSGGYSGTAGATSSSVSGGYVVTQNNQNGWAGGGYHSP